MIKLLTSKGFSIAVGLLLIFVSVGGLWWEDARRHNPLDQVAQTAQASGPEASEPDPDGGENRSVSLEQLDEDVNFIPLLETQSDDYASGEDGQAGQVFLPDRIVIPAINLDAPVVPVGFQEVQLNFKTYKQWLVPNQYAAGWHVSSATLSLPGNTVLNGHHNVFGKVFADLVLLQPDDLILVYAGEAVFQYQVETKMLLAERYQELSTRMENARWLSSSEDERLTLVTCWPADSNTHRVVIVAFPLSGQDGIP